MLYNRKRILWLLTVWFCNCATLAVAASGTDVVGTRGEYAHLLTSWPQGTGGIVNDGCRTTGWHPWFTEWPNDVHHYALMS